MELSFTRRDLLRDALMGAAALNLGGWTGSCRRACAAIRPT
jgi:hypothetical protein